MTRVITRYTWSYNESHIRVIYEYMLILISKPSGRVSPREGRLYAGVPTGPSTPRKGDIDRM